MRITSTLSRRRINKLYLFWLIVFCFIPAFAFTGADDLNEDMKDFNSPFGVLEFLHWNHTWNNYKYSRHEDYKQAVMLMKEAGISWVRMDFLWDEIEPGQGEFNFKKYDEIVKLLYENNINILGLLNYSAPWAAIGGAWNYPPEDIKLFVNYACRVISHYKDKIKFWEVWNEPDSSTYWATQDGLKTYCGLLKEVYIAAKEVDPECKILNGGLANGLSSINRLYDNGAKDYFDILNIHFFENPLNPSAIKRVIAYPGLAYKVMSRNGDAQKKIWITEIGTPGVRRGKRVKNWWMGKNPSERQQAKWLKQAYAELLKDGKVEKVFWAFLRDCQEHWANGVDYFGLLRWDFSRKPSFLAYKECVNNWKKRKK